MKSQYDFQELGRHFDDSYESDIYRISPQVCRKCGAIVAWDYTMQHLEWHTTMEAAK